MSVLYGVDLGSRVEEVLVVLDSMYSNSAPVPFVWFGTVLLRFACTSSPLSMQHPVYIFPSIAAESVRRSRRWRVDGRVKSQSGH